MSLEGSDNPYASPVPEQPPAEQPALLPVAATQAPEIQKLLQQGANGANWFYWVAGLSLVNSAIIHFGGDWHFVIGLGTTLITDSIAAVAVKESPEIAFPVKGFAIAFDLLVSLCVAGCGWLASKRIQFVFAAGMVLYLFDGLLFLPFGDILSIAFHGYALFCMWHGFSAFRKLNAIERELSSPPPLEGATTWP